MKLNKKARARWMRRMSVRAKWVLYRLRHFLLGIDPERFICLGYRAGNSARQLLAVYAGYSLLATLLLLLPWAHRADIHWVDHLFMYIGRVGVVTFGSALLARSHYPHPRSREDMAV